MTQDPRSNSHEQARIREFFFHGVDSFHLHWSIDALSMLLHLSIFLFFSGLLLYLFNVHHNVVFYLVVSWVAVSTLGYIFITAMPIFRTNCPYHAPLSISAWYLYAIVSYMVLLLLSCFSSCRSWLGNIGDLRKRYRDRIFYGMKKTTERVVRETSKDIDGRILKSVIHASIEDREQDRLFQCILDFCSSKVVDKPKFILHNLKGEISSILIPYLNRTWSSNVVSERDKILRFVKCVKVADVARLSPVVLNILHDVFPSGNPPSDNLPSDNLPSDKPMVLRSVVTGKFLRERDHGKDREIGLCAQLVVAGIIANGDQNNKEWIALATDQLGEYLPRDREHSRDSVLLANLIHVTHLILDSFSDGLDIGHRVSYIVLPRLSGFDICNTRSELQDEFWDLWEDIESRRGADSRLIHVINCLDPICRALNDDSPTTSQKISSVIFTEPLVATHIPIVTPFSPILPHSSSTSIAPTHDSASPSLLAP